MKPNVYINPNAPEGVKNMLRKAFPDATELSGEEAQRRIDAQTARELRRMPNRDLLDAFAASARSDDAEGVEALGAELLRRLDEAKQ
jgi:hypothetical protein